MTLPDGPRALGAKILDEMITKLNAAGYVDAKEPNTQCGTMRRVTKERRRDKVGFFSGVVGVHVSWSPAGKRHLDCLISPTLVYSIVSRIATKVNDTESYPGVHTQAHTRARTHAHILKLEWEKVRLVHFHLDSTLVFDGGIVLNFGPGPTFDSDSVPLLNFAPRSAFNCDPTTNLSFDFDSHPTSSGYSVLGSSEPHQLVLGLSEALSVCCLEKRAFRVEKSTALALALSEIAPTLTKGHCVAATYRRIAARPRHASYANSNSIHLPHTYEIGIAVSRVRIASHRRAGVDEPDGDVCSDAFEPLRLCVLR
ncbi:hypothetical protein EVAR_20289_1 [Eumeta japonica]|uniref:Uncharacterized protein n=1 Tax=Eumeta variegata TaxID=151549 RepID=A0A4C1VP54_EUMVA|nr:hypothetical protein EVAR_20289_1 [Eumeta japonica]